QSWVRRLDSVEMRALPGTEGAQIPFWSPESRFIGFFADRKLKRVDAGGGPVQIICDAPSTDASGAWNEKGVILFSGGRPSVPISRISAEGGVPSPITKFGPED